MRDVITTLAIVGMLIYYVGATHQEPRRDAQASSAIEDTQDDISSLTLAPSDLGVYSSNSISLSGDMGYNVSCALSANGGALTRFSVPTGAAWSFNASVGNPATVCHIVAYGVDGGGWCNLAARYAQVARAMGMDVDFEDHGLGDLGGGYENSVAIWNLDGSPGSESGKQDLVIYNTTDRVVYFEVTRDREFATVHARH